MQLSTENFTHVLVFFDKSHLFITEKKYNWFLEQSAVAGQSGVQFNNRYIAFGSVAQALELAEFYDQYPQYRDTNISSRRSFTQERIDQEELEKHAKEKELDRQTYPEGGFAMNIKKEGKPDSWWMDSCIESFKQQIVEAKAKGEPYEGKVRLLGLMEASRLKKYGKVNA